MRRDSKKLFQEGQVIVVHGQPCLITGIGGDGSTNDTETVHFHAIASDGTLSGPTPSNGWLYPWNAKEKGYEGHIDFAQAGTVVKLPPEWQKRVVEYELAEKAKPSPIDDWEPETHPSYGSVYVGRVSGHTQLFMSPFKHQHYMTLTIRRSTKHRGHANDRIHASEQLIEVALSEAQWARFVSCAGGNYEGVPCTIERVGGEQMPRCPEQVEVERFHLDVRRKLEKSAEALDAAVEQVQKLLEQPSVTKAERKELLGKLKTARAHLADGLPFIAEQLRERMEHIVEEGKTEVEAFFQRMVERLGLKQLVGASPVELKVLPKRTPAPPIAPALEDKP